MLDNLFHCHVDGLGDATAGWTCDCRTSETRKWRACLKLSALAALPGSFTRLADVFCCHDAALKLLCHALIKRSAIFPWALHVDASAGCPGLRCLNETVDFLGISQRVLPSRRYHGFLLQSGLLGLEEIVHPLVCCFDSFRALRHVIPYGLTVGIDLRASPHAVACH